MNQPTVEGLVMLRAGAARLSLVPALGGRITACYLQGKDGLVQSVLQPYPETHTDLDVWAKGGLYPLVPYSGRIRDARLRHGGRVWPLEPYPASPHTLHGIAHRRPWVLAEHNGRHAVLTYRHRCDPHWPWDFDATLTVALSADTLSVDLRLCHLGEGEMPAGIGLHPYLLHDPRECIRYRADPAWPFDADYLALGAAPPKRGETEQGIGPSDCSAGEVTRFHAGWHGPLEVLDCVTGLPRLRLQARGAFDQLVIHRPAAARYVCVEPVSHVADGFNLAAAGVGGTGIRVLAPGMCLQGGVEITAL